MNSFNNGPAGAKRRTTKDLRVAIDAELCDLVDRLAKIRRIDRSEIVNSALRSVLVQGPEITNLIETVEALSGQIEAIAEIVADATRGTDRR